MKTALVIHNCTQTGEKWIYETKKTGERLYELRAFLPSANPGDHILIHRDVPLFEITQIISARDHKGVFINKLMAKNSYVICEVRQLTKQEYEKLLGINQ